MAKSKATHKGECQICGRVQKLPNGKLSQHGYTVQWSMFQGICPGSQELPYEQSCELIKFRLPFVQEQLKRLFNEKTALLQQAIEPKAHVRIYSKNEYRYKWVVANLSVVTKRNESSSYEWQEIIATYKDGDSERQSNESKGRAAGNETVLEAATRLNKAYVNQVIVPNIKQTEDYLKWCRERIKNWQVRDLQDL